MIPSETKHSDTILWEQLWYPRKQSTAIPCYENSYDTLGNKAQRYHIMRTVMIPSETKHSDTILWEQLWFPRKQSTAIPYYENSYEILGNKGQQYHIMRTVMIPSETQHSSTILWEQLWYPRKQSTAIQYYENSYGYHSCSHSMVLLCFDSEGIIAVLIVRYCCALFPRVS
jgi:hypothetical protein